MKRLTWPACAVALLLAVAVGANAQQLTPTPTPTSTFLPASHWSIPVARRLAQLGLATPDFGFGDGSLARAAVGRVLCNAATNAPASHPELAALALGYCTRFTQEFPETASLLGHPTNNPTTRGEGAAFLGYSSAAGRIFPVRSLDRTREDITGPFPRSNLSTFDAAASLSLDLGSHLAGSITPQHQDGDWSIQEGYAVASFGKFGVWAGRRAPSFATGTGGGIVLNGTAAFTGGGFNTMEPVRLPWILRYIGALRFETFLSQIDSNAAIKKPFFFATHASVSPIPRLEFGISQAFMFSGSGLPPFNFQNFKEMFFAHGIVSAGQEFENGVASGEIRFRPPVPLIPISLYMEWGADDNHAAWVYFPGRVIGGQIPAIPGLPALSLGLENTSFSRPCTVCGSCHCEYFSTWYRHYVFKDGWTLDREPIGHPLGGQGYEWLVYGTWDNPASRLRLDGRTFLRDRGPFNIYSPARQGHSTGGSLAAVYRATPHLDVLFTSALEKGHDWRESSLTTGFRWLF